MREHTPKPQPMSNRRAVRDELHRLAGWIEVKPGKWGHPDNVKKELSYKVSCTCDQPNLKCPIHDFAFSEDEL